MRRITSRSHPASCVFILMSFCFSGIKIYFSYCTRQWASPRHYHFIQHWTLLVLQPFLTPTVSPSPGGPLPLIYVPLDNASLVSSHQRHPAENVDEAPVPRCSHPFLPALPGSHTAAGCCPLPTLGRTCYFPHFTVDIIFFKFFF